MAYLTTQEIATKLKPLSDDELLAYFVDDTPFMAMSDYRRRCGFAPDIPSNDVLRTYFNREWDRRYHGVKP